MIRVARILGRANVGGPTETVLRLCRELDDGEAFRTVLFVGRSGPREGDRLAGEVPCEVRRVGGLRRRPSPLDLRAVGPLRRALAEFAPDVVHTHASKAGLLGRLAALRLDPRPRLVHTFHGHVFEGYFPAPLARSIVWLERRLAAVTDLIVAVSEATARDLTRRFKVAPADRVVVVPNGIDLQRFRPVGEEERAALRRALGWEAGLHVVVPARLVPIKGHDLLFEALARWREPPDRVWVHLAGDGPLRERLERRALGLGSAVRVRFAGLVSDVAPLLAAADAVVLPSWNEGMPLSLLEAMACGTPVVATAVGGVPEIVVHGRTGLIVPRGDAGSLSAALRRLLGAAGERAEMGRAARLRAESFGIERVISAHRRLYREVLGGERGRRGAGGGVRAWTARSIS